MVQYLYAPKRSCPWDLGYWYCDDCKARHLEESSNIDFPIKIYSYCEGKKFDAMICGKTHLGFAWCKECQEEGTFEPNPHIHKYVIVGKIVEDKELP